MASAIIHMAVANEINKILKYDNNQMLIGSIAPDIAKIIGESKLKSHFLDSLDNDIPNIEKFLDKYKSFLNDSFVMGYFIHLCTDYLWFKYFISEFYRNDMITKLDGTSVKCTSELLHEYIYNDYTNLNIKLLDEYNMDLKIFYNELPVFQNIIKEIPMDRIELVVKKMSIIIGNSKDDKTLVFDIDNIKKFIVLSINFILDKIKEIKVTS